MFRHMGDREMNKTELEGELFTLEEEDDEGSHYCAEVNGINIWKWLQQNSGHNVKITLEVKN